MRNMIYGAEIKAEYIQSLPKNKQDLAYAYLTNLQDGELRENMHLFEMSPEIVTRTVLLSEHPPTSVETARKVKNFICDYWKWAKANNYATQETNPFDGRTKLPYFQLLSARNVVARYPKDINDLYERIVNIEEISEEQGKWSFIALGLLLVYDGCDEKELGGLRYDDIDFEAKNIITPTGVVVLSSITIQVIETVHRFQEINSSPRAKHARIRAVSDNSYVIPRIESTSGGLGLKPLFGHEFSTQIAGYKRDEQVYASKYDLVSQTEYADWLTSDSVKTSGCFYRAYAIGEGLKSKIDEELYQLWKKGHNL